MQKTLISSLIMLAGMATFWAYTTVETPIHDFKLNITYINLGWIFILGLIVGAGLGNVGVIERKQSF